MIQHIVGVDFRIGAPPRRCWQNLLCIGFLGDDVLGGLSHGI